MRALLDTHVLIWWLMDDARLSPRARALFGDGRNVLLWSAASSWELAIKSALGRIRFPVPLRSYLPRELARQGIASLPVEHVHAFEVPELPPHHRDPFDRMLVAQARVERVPLVSADAALRPYDVRLLW